MKSHICGVEQANPIEVFAVSKAFTDDPHEKKVNLSVGAYRTDEGKPWVLPVVRKVEEELALDVSQNHEYLPILGLPSFVQAASQLVLGENSKAITDGRAVGVQVLSGTGGLRIAAEFLNKILKFSTFYYSNPTWGNHRLIFLNAGFSVAKQYRYWNEEKRDLDFDGMMDDLRNAPEKTAVILHTCAHNPTGVDLSRDQWIKLADLIMEKNHFPIFDSAYQGFASGDLDNDAWPVRYFVEKGLEIIVTQSFSKNFGLYNERIGNLVIVVNDKSVIEPMRSQLTLLVRSSYSNPPNHGARIVSRILNDKNLFAEWKQCIVTMSCRIKDMRHGVSERLKKLGTPGNWDHITSQIGMFSYTGLSASQAKFLAEKYHIYLLSSGRINMCGINSHNIDYVAMAIDDAVKNVCN